MQGTRVWYLVQEDPTCCGATKPTHHNYRAHAHGNPCSTTRGAATRRRPSTATSELLVGSPPLATTRENPCIAINKQGNERIRSEIFEYSSLETQEAWLHPPTRHPSLGGKKASTSHVSSQGCTAGRGATGQMCHLLQASQSSSRIWEEKYRFYVKRDKMYYEMEYKIEVFIRKKKGDHLNKFSQASSGQFEAGPNLWGGGCWIFHVEAESSTSYNLISLSWT